MCLNSNRKLSNIALCNMGELMSDTQVKRNTILAYGGLATPLAMIGYPIAIWLIPLFRGRWYSLYIIANLLLVARFTDVITDPILGQLGDSTKHRLAEENLG